MFCVLEFEYTGASSRTYEGYTSGGRCGEVSEEGEVEFVGELEAAESVEIVVLA